MSGELPPILGSPLDAAGGEQRAEAPPSRPPSRLGSFVALVLLATYVVIPALLGAGHDRGDGTLLPGSVRAVLTVCGLELSLFAAAFAIAAWLGRLRASDLYLAWRGWWVIPRSFGWSIALRFGVGLLLATALALWQLGSGAPIASLEGLRPRVEAMVDVAALRDPVYLALMLTLVSFVLAGLREELWRIGMITLLGRVFPRVFGGRLGPWLALLPTAVLFGLAHTPQGWVGVAATTGLGLGLGAILLFHRSLWDAVLAHGFFNAATFAVLPWLADYLTRLKA